MSLISISEQLEYKDVCKYLFQMQDDSKRIKNKTISLLLEYDGFVSDYVKKNKSKPDNENIFGCKTIGGQINRILKDQFNYMYYSNLSCLIQSAAKRYKEDKKDMIYGNKSCPSYEKVQPIELHNNAIVLNFSDNIWYVNLKLFSKNKSKEIGLDNTELPFKIQVKSNSQKAILERCFDEEYHISGSQLVYDKKKKMWVLLLNYNFENKKIETLDEKNIMGIDLGINIPIYYSFNNSLDSGFINRSEIDAFRTKVEKRKKSLQKQGKYCGEGRIGHGIQTRINPMYTNGNKIANFRDTINHRYSKYIVDMAVKHNCGVIQMEDLSGISSHNKFLKNWTYYDLQQKIKYKFESLGGQVVFINPKYTSQRCSKCGYIDNANRPKDTKGQAYFKCQHCGNECNADYNASQNIATKDIEIIIKNTKINDCKVCEI